MLCSRFRFFWLACHHGLLFLVPSPVRYTQRETSHVFHPRVLSSVRSTQCEHVDAVVLEFIFFCSPAMSFSPCECRYSVCRFELRQRTPVTVTCVEVTDHVVLWSFTCFTSTLIERKIIQSDTPYRPDHHCSSSSSCRSSFSAPIEIWKTTTSPYQVVHQMYLFMYVDIRRHF